MYAKEVAAYLKDCLFPVNCVNCNEEGEWLCKPCRTEVYAKPALVGCPVCALTNETGAPCLNCQAVSYVDKITAFFNYHTKVAKLIHLFKYQFSTGLLVLWKELLSGSKFTFKDTVVVPVPLHPRRERERGFNQAALLGKIIADCFCLPYNNSSLKRSRYTSQQAKLNREKRLQNMQKAFSWQSDAPVPHSILLVDDVFTTGTTMQECARVLKENGAKHVEGLVLARD